MIPELFAGPGGWSEGLRTIGLSDVGLEWDDAACRTRAAAGHLTVRTDVAQYPVEPFVGKARGLIASPPCQAWSMAGKGKGRGEVDRVHAAVELCRDGWTDEALSWEWADARTPLILQPLRWAWGLRDSLEWVACEQVPPALDVWKHVADVLRSWGFASDARVLCAADYGVPQTRNRAFIIATKGALRWPEPTHAERPEPSLFGGTRKPWVTMAEALGWGGSVETNATTSATGDSYARGTDRSSPVVLPNVSKWKRRLSPGLTPSQPNRRTYEPTEPAPTLTFGHDAANWKWVHGRPATTVQADARIGRPGHKDRSGGEAQFQHDAVRVTVEEAAVLQGFPRSYPWQGTKSKQFEQVGNVVCPPVAAAIIGALTGIDYSEAAA